MSAEASPQAAAPGESAASKKESQRNKRWETLVEIVEVLVPAIVAVATSWSGYVAAIAQRFKVRAVRVTTTVIALALAGYTTVAMLAMPRVWRHGIR